MFLDTNRVRIMTVKTYGWRGRTYSFTRKYISIVFLNVSLTTKAKSRDREEGKELVRARIFTCRQTGGASELNSEFT